MAGVTGINHIAFAVKIGERTAQIRQRTAGKSATSVAKREGREGKTTESRIESSSE